MDNNIERLLKVADEFDAAGHRDLADNITRVLKLAAQVQVNYDYSRPYNPEEEQRLIAIEYKHLYKMYLDTLSDIEYLKRFWPTIRAALDHAYLVISDKMEDKTNSFDFNKFKQRFEHIEAIRTKFKNWAKQPITRSRVIMERQLMLSPLKMLIQRLGSTFEDDAALEQIYQELKTLVNVFNNVLEQTASEIADIDFPKGV